MDKTTPDDLSLFNSMTGASALILPDEPDYTVVAATQELTEWAGITREELVGSSLFRYFPDNPDAPNVSDSIRSSLAICLKEKQRNELPLQRYDIELADGTFHEMYWRIIHAPVLDNQGEIKYIIHSAINVTDKVLAGIKDEEIHRLEPAYNIIKRSNIAIHVFRGPDLIVDMANDATLKFWGKDPDVIGKPVREVLPELDAQYLEILERVYRTGIPYQANEAPVSFHRDGQEVTLYFNFVLQPYFADDSPHPVGVVASANDITEDFLTRKALAEKERSLALAQEIGDLGVFTVDLKSNNASYSPQIMEWLEVTKLNLPVKEILKRVHAEDYEMVSAIMSGEYNVSQNHDIVFRVPHPNTEEVQYLRSIGQMQTEDGVPVTISGIIQDITKSVESQTALELSAQRLKSVIESAPFPIGVYVGREMRIEMVNQAILEVWGRPLSVVGKRYSEVLPELEGQGPFEQLDQVFMTGVPFHAHNRRIELELDGKLKTYYFNYSFTPLYNAMGKIYGVMNTAANVTDLNLAKQKIEQSERNLKNMILQAPVAMCLMRAPEYSIEVVNNPMLQIWDKPLSEIINQPVFNALPDSGRRKLRSVLDYVVSTGESVSVNELPVVLNRSGKEETVYQNVVYQPYRSSDGEIIGVLAISVDVSGQVLARHKIEEIVRERTKDLELANLRLHSSNAELEQFAYIASHDLQEPLRKIGMFTQMLEEEIGEVSPRARNQMDRIKNAVGRMNNLIRDILGYSQLSRKNEVFQKVRLNEVVDEVLSDFDLVLDEKKGAVIADELPEVDAIPLQMVQLFNNLLSNALKYSKPDVPPIIQIRAEVLPKERETEFDLSPTHGNYHQVMVSDNGIGFQQEYAQKIFNIFQRLHGKMEYAGTGIGLAMCKKIADNHHGAIYARSTEGVGSTFVVILPEHQ